MATLAGITSFASGVQQGRLRKQQYDQSQQDRSMELANNAAKRLQDMTDQDRKEGEDFVAFARGLTAKGVKLSPEQLTSLAISRYGRIPKMIQALWEAKHSDTTQTPSLQPNAPESSPVAPQMGAGSSLPMPDAVSPRFLPQGGMSPTPGQPMSAIGAAPFVSQPPQEGATPVPPEGAVLNAPQAPAMARDLSPWDAMMEPDRFGPQERYLFNKDVLEKTITDKAGYAGYFAGIDPSASDFAQKMDIASEKVRAAEIELAKGKVRPGKTRGQAWLDSFKSSRRYFDPETNRAADRAAMILDDPNTSEEEKQSAMDAVGYAPSAKEKANIDYLKAGVKARESVADLNKFLVGFKPKEMQSRANIAELGRKAQMAIAHMRDAREGARIAIAQGMMSLSAKGVDSLTASRSAGTAIDSYNALRQQNSAIAGIVNNLTTSALLTDDEGTKSEIQSQIDDLTNAFSENTDALQQMAPSIKALGDKAAPKPTAKPNPKPPVSGNPLSGVLNVKPFDPRQLMDPNFAAKFNAESQRIIRQKTGKKYGKPTGNAAKPKPKPKPTVKRGKSKRGTSYTVTVR